MSAVALSDAIEIAGRVQGERSIGANDAGKVVDNLKGPARARR